MTISVRDFRYIDRRPIGERIARFAWSVAYCTLFRPTPRWALAGWRSFLLRLFGASVGHGCRIAPSVRIWAPWRLHLGDYVAIGDDVDCYCVDNITLGSKVTVSQRSFLCTASHDVASLRRPLTTAPIVVADHVWIAANVIVLPGNSIGEGAVVGAGAVVARDLAPWAVYVGNPCRRLRSRPDERGLIDGIS